MQASVSLYELAKSLRGLVIPFLPFLIPKLYTWLRTAHAQHQQKRLVPLTLANWAVISLLLVGSLVQVLVVLPGLWPQQNVFGVTGSRLQTPVEVIESRLKQLYGASYERAPYSVETGAGALDYGLLVSRLSSSTGKALYTVYGTDVYAGCEWCRTDRPSLFFVYALPSIVLPHLGNLLLLLLATTTVSTASSRQWHGYVLWVSLGLMLFDVYTVYTAPNNLHRVMTAYHLDSVPWVFLAQHKFRTYSFALLDAALAAATFLSASGRFFVVDEATTQRAARVILQLEHALARLRAAIVLHSNVVAKDQTLRDSYMEWGEVCETREALVRSLPEIQEARKMAKSRLVPSFQQFQLTAETFVDGVYSTQYT